MTPEAAKFIEDMKRIDPRIGDLVAKELERGANLYAMQEFLRGAMALERDRRAREPKP